MTERSMPLEGVFITYSFQEKRAHQDIAGKHHALSEGRRSDRNASLRAYILFHRKEGARKASTALGLDSLNNFSGP